MADGNPVLSQPVFDLNADTSLEQPDMNDMRDERFNRNRATMRMVDRHVSDQILPQTSTLSRDEKAAIKIQALYRGHLGRKKYVNLLYQQYEQEFEMQRQKTLMQMEEGDLLVQNHRLEVECEDNRTTRRNKVRQYEANIITIQRAWRRHLGRAGRTSGGIEGGSVSKLVEPVVVTTDTESGGQPMSISTSIDSLRNARSEDDLLSDLSQDMSPYVSVKGSRDSLLGSSSGQEELTAAGLTPRPLTNKNIRIDADPESMVSDISEMADSIKEHLANVQIIRKEDLDFENTLQNDALVQQKIQRLPGESDSDYAKRLRKLNFLSLAQEFAALKSVDSQALPFGAHKAQQLPSPMSEGTVSDNNSDSGSAHTPSEGRKDFTFIAEKTGTKQAWQEMRGGGRDDHQQHSNNPGSSHGNITKTHANRQSHNPSLQSSQPFDAKRPLRHHNPTGLPASATEDEPDSESKTIVDQKMKKEELSSFEKQHEALSPFKHSMYRSGGTGNKEGSEGKVIANGSAGPAGGKGDFDVYNMECTLPTMDWDKLEHELQKAAEEERNKKTRKNDREEILRKLAMGPEEDSPVFAGDRPLKKAGSQTRYHQTGHNLQVCFMNENIEEPPASSTQQVSAPGDEASVQVSVTKAQPAPEENLDLPSRKQKLQDEATIALAQVRPMAKMQLQVEKQVKKKSPIAEITGIPELGDGKILQLSVHMLHEMNVAQLQVILNDLHSQIEGLNMELVSLLIERDDLHMEQDSMLVDIEDLHRRAEELSERVTMVPNFQKRSKDRSK